MNKQSRDEAVSEKKPIPFTLKSFITTLRAWRILLTTLHYWIVNKLVRRRNAAMICEMLQYPDPRLSAPNAFIDFQTSTVKDRTEILKKLNASLNAQEWGSKLGIAAPQIGINVRACIVAGIPMFNPEFVAPKHGAPVEMIEGCYSLPQNQLYKVQRAKYGWVKWYDVNGVYHDEKFTGLKAIVAQHEISHLDGKCCNQLGTLCVKS